jgi:uncharacterized protein (TIGR00251 family)
MKVLIKVKPNSKDEGIAQEGDIFTVRVREPPREGKANQAVIKLLAQHFGVPGSQVRILSGLRSKNKIIELIAKD